MNMDTGHWEGVAPDTAANVGFVYVITNLLNQRMYIGKKAYAANRRVKVKGQKRRKRTTSYNGWREYTGSSRTLNEDIEKLGKENFKFEIVAEASSKSSLNYLEMELQVFSDCLKARFADGTRAFYNGMIAGARGIPKGEAYPAMAERQRGARNSIHTAVENGNHPTLGKGHKEETKVIIGHVAKEWWASLTPKERVAHGKKTAGHGEANGNAKFSQEEVNEIRAKWQSGEYRFKSHLAREYKDRCGSTAINKILTGESWPEREGEVG